MSMHTAEPRLVAEKGKYRIWCVEYVCENSGNIDRRYEVRREDLVLEQFDNENEAMAEMLLQDRMEVQNRSSGPGM